MKRVEPANCAKIRARLNAGFGGDFEIARSGGFKFVRQEPVGPYFADFVCREEKFVVEVDGATRSADDERGRDAKREQFLHDRGYRVARFGNDEVYWVLDTILAALERRGTL